MDKFENQAYKEKVTNRIIDLIDESKLFYSHEVKIFTHLLEKYQPMTLTDYAKHIGKSYKTVSLNHKDRKYAFITFGGVDFILAKLN